MADFASQVDYIISYRESTPDRRKTLLFVTRWLHRAFPQLNITIVEQDTQPKLETSVPEYCHYLFLYNPGLFNRGWSNNVGGAATANPYLIFGDADVFMDKSAYLQSFEYLQDFEAVDPKKNYVWGVDDVDVESLGFSNHAIRYGNTFGGGIFLIQRKAYESIGTWDETFERWGGEDNVMEHIIRSYLRHCRLHLDVYHISHERTIFDGRQQPHYQSNSEHSQFICSLHGERLINYMNDKKSQPKACVGKYAHAAPHQNQG